MPEEKTTSVAETLAGEGSESLHVSLADHIAVLEIRRPPANYFDEQLIRELAEAAKRLDDDPECRVLVLCSEGKHFCAGANFGGSFDPNRVDRAVSARRLYESAMELLETRKPIIAAVQGAAVGGGFGLACAADFRVVDEKTRFIANFSQLGFHPGFGLTGTLPGIVGEQRAAGMLYGGEVVRGERAFAIGLADRLAGLGQQREAAMDWARQIADSAPLAVEAIRETLRVGLPERVRTALERELSEQARLWQTEDSKEGIAANLERRKAVFHRR